jgi:1,4-alpha-glucan branching enzyme
MPAKNTRSPAKKKKTRAASAREFPLGPTVLPGEAGVAFRVWAPMADAVSVVGPFNDWRDDAHPLVRADDGTWSAVVPPAREGSEYRYALRRGQDRFTRIDPRALKVTNSIGNGVVWTPPPLPDISKNFTPPTLDSLVIYELHVGTFHTTPEAGPGTFASAIEKLPYLRDLGVNCVELMPVAEFAGDFSWGYNPAHPWAVESRYGGPEGLRAFVEAAHHHGIAVVLDVVYNHFGPGDLCLWRFDGWSENDLGGVYFYNDHRARTPWGDSRPDYGRGEVRAYLRDNALMWLETYGVDGLRWDATAYVRTINGAEHEDLPEGWSLCQWLNDELKRAKPGFITIAEDLRDNPWVVKDTGAGGAGFSAQWDGAFVHPVRAVLAAPRDEDRDLDALVQALRHRHEGDAFRRVVYSESHDEVANGKARLPSEIDHANPDGYPARKRSALAALLAFTAPGVPMLFQGQEILEDEWFRDEVPLDWSKHVRHGAVHALYRDLVALRRDLRGQTRGLAGQHIEINHVDHAGKVLAYRRWREDDAGDDVLVVLNLSAHPRNGCELGAPRAGAWHVRLNTDSTAYSGDFADHGEPVAHSRPDPLDGYAHRITVDLAPYSALVLSRDPA